jgi:hypothetical protein
MHICYVEYIVEMRRFTINYFMCCSWEIALNFGLDVLFDNMYISKGIGEQVEVSSLKA